MPRTANITVRCVWANVWTTKGKLLKGDTASLSPSEADALIAQGSCKESTK